MDIDTLELAVKQGRNSIVKQFIARGTPLNVPDVYGRTPLMLAILHGHKDITKMLIDAGVGIDAKDEHHRTYLISAAEKGHHDIVEMLLKTKIDINAQDYDDFTALMHAAKNGYKTIVEALLEAHADVTIKAHGNTALTFAKKQGHTDIAKMIEEEGKTPGYVAREKQRRLRASSGQEGDIQWFVE